MEKDERLQFIIGIHIILQTNKTLFSPYLQLLLSPATYPSLCKFCNSSSTSKNNSTHLTPPNSAILFKRITGTTQVPVLYQEPSVFILYNLILAVTAEGCIILFN